jgi:glycosyltransferase involved in cell wall biosynthesis
LVESLAAGNAVIAHDNPFNRWVAGEGARYFKSPGDLAEILESLDGEGSQLLNMEEASRKRHHESFTQDKILRAYEELLLRFAPEDSVLLHPKQSASATEDDLSVGSDRGSVR